jgi:hypothetical protein
MNPTQLKYQQPKQDMQTEFEPFINAATTTRKKETGQHDATQTAPNS